MFKFKSASMLLAIVAVLTLCTFTAKAQTKSDTLVTIQFDSAATAATAHGHVLLEIDSALIDTAGKTITILGNLPTKNIPEAWAAYTIAALGAVWGLYSYIQKKRLAGVPKMPNPPPVPGARVVKPGPAPVEKQTGPLETYTEGDIIDQLHKQTYAEAVSMPIPKGKKKAPNPNQQRNAGGKFTKTQK